MRYVYDFGIPAIWIAWFIYWRLAAEDVKTTVRREAVGVRILYIGLLVAGALLFSFSFKPPTILDRHIYPETRTTFWLGVLLMFLGFAFTAWARVILGRNWSATVTLKENHELVQSGPYGLVRHPIYTGLMLMFVGTAVTIGEWRGVLALALILTSFLIKLRIEERWMTELFGEKYALYRKHVRMLIPWIW